MYLWRIKPNQKLLTTRNFKVIMLFFLLPFYHYCFLLLNNLFYVANSSIIVCAAEIWNAIISSPVGIICVGGKRNPKVPVSLNSIEYAYGMPASPKAQSAELPEAMYRSSGICPTSYVVPWVAFNALLPYKFYRNSFHSLTTCFNITFVVIMSSW